MMEITAEDIEALADDTIAYYDVNRGRAQENWHGDKKDDKWSNENALIPAAPALGVCCFCSACNCHCHTAGTANNQFNNENFVRYLFDYDIFSIAHNFSRCGYLIAYLQHEGLIGNACVIVKGSHSLHGAYAHPVVSKAASENTPYHKKSAGVRVDISRTKTSGNLQFKRPTNLIEPLLDVPDVRLLMRNYILSDPSRDWLDLRYALQMPTFLIYVKLDGSANHLANADLTAMFDLRQLRVIESGISVGRRLAELVAGIREKYFGVPLPDFDVIEQAFSHMLLDRSLRKQQGTPVFTWTPHEKASSSSPGYASSALDYDNTDSATRAPSQRWQ